MAVKADVSLKSFGALACVALIFALIGNALTASRASRLALVAATEASFTIDAPRDCASAIQKALGKASDGAATGIAVEKAGVLDACYGAVLQPGKTPSANPNDYICVGRTGTVTVAFEGTTAVTTPLPGSKPGECKLTVQDAVFSGTSEPATSGIQAPQTGVQSAPQQAGVSSDQGIVTGSFSGQEHLEASFKSLEQGSNPSVLDGVKSVQTTNESMPIINTKLESAFGKTVDTFGTPSSGALDQGGSLLSPEVSGPKHFQPTLQQFDVTSSHTTGYGTFVEQPKIIQYDGSFLQGPKSQYTGFADAIMNNPDIPASVNVEDRRGEALISNSNAGSGQGFWGGVANMGSQIWKTITGFF